MSMCLRSVDDTEDCLDPEAFSKREFPADLIIEKLLKLSLEGKHVEELIIDPELYDNFEDQMGKKLDMKDYQVIFGPYGLVKIIRG